MSFPVTPNHVASQPQVVSLPQTQRIVQDVVDCVHQLKEDFASSKAPITDDSQVLQRFCAKLEHLLQFEMKERFTLLGKRKDYWDYFCDCLASNKGANDGIKYVKALGEHKTSLGKGRAFIRFSLVHQRLADTLQQCAIHPKTAEWYNPAGVWVRQALSSSVINTLYDLNGLHFDLSPRGYDLDNAWPSFARNMPGAGNWNVPASRRSSITSMDTLSLVSTDPGEVSRLQQELASAETARSVLAENVTSLEQERQRAEQSVWMTQGELTALQDQLKVTGRKLEELQHKHSALELSHSQLQAEKQEQGKAADRQAAELSAQQHRLSQEREQLTQQEAVLTQKAEKDRAHLTGEIETLRHSLIEVTDARDKLTSKVTSLEEAVEQAKSWDAKKEQQISRLEQQTASLEQRNKELMEEMARSLSSREQDAASQLDSAHKLQDLLSKLKEVEAHNVQLQGSLVDLRHRCEVAEKAAEEERTRRDDSDSKLAAETQKCESMSSELQTLKTELEREKASRSEAEEKLQAQINHVQAEHDRTKAELSSATDALTNSQSQQSRVTSFLSQLMQVALDSSGANVQSPDISQCSENDMTHFVQACQQSSEVRFSDLSSSLEAAKKQNSMLTAEKHAILQSVDTIFDILPDKPDGHCQELAPRVQEVERGVRSLCRQVSDLTANNAFLSDQLHLAQGDQTDKGKQLSHQEGRLLELEKSLKESRASESALQGQVASMDVTLKSSQQQSADLQSRLQTTTADLEARTQALQGLQQDKSALEQRAEDLETQVAQLTSSVGVGRQEVEEKAAEGEGLRGKVAQLESALEEVRQELEDKRSQMTQMQVKVKEGEETVEKFLASMASLETDKASIATEHDGLQQQLAEVTSQLTSALADKQRHQSHNEQLQQEMTQLSQQHSALKEHLQSKESEATSLRQSLESDAQKHSEAVEELKRQVDKALVESNQFREQAEENSEKLKDVTSLRESAVAERDSAVEKLEQISCQLKEKEVALTEQLQSLHVQLETLQTEKEELRKSSSSSQEETTKLLTEKQDLVSSLQQEKADLEKRVKDLSQQKETLEADVATVQTELEEVKKAAEGRKNKLTQELQETRNKLQSDVDGLRQQNSDLSRDLEEAKSDLNKKVGEIQEARMEIETTKSESDRLRSDSASEKSELEDSLEKLQSRFSELQTAMDAILREKEELTAMQTASQEEIAELKADLASSADGYNFLLQSSQKVHDEKDAEIQTLTLQLADLEQAKQELSAEMESSSSHRRSLEEKLSRLETDRDALKGREQELENSLREKSRELGELGDLVKSLNSSMAVLEEDDRARREEVSRLEGVLKDKESEFSTQLEALEQEVSALQFQLSSEQLQHQESVRTMGNQETSAAEMARRLTDQEALIGDLEKELTSLQVDFETERTNQNQQLEELKGLLKTKENACRLLAEQLQKSCDKLAEAVSAAEFYQKENSALRITVDRDLDEREEEIRTLRSDNEQLKKQLVKAIRDKAALWQQTDALAYQHKRKAEGKWMDSSTVTKCMGCQADFSLFLRKHHCRLCGGIFCYSCSDHWVDSTSSSRKARACAQCYTDLQKLDASIAKASLLPDDSDDDSSNVGSDAASPQGSQVDSQSQSSLLQAATPDVSACAGEENEHSSPVSFGEDVYARKTPSSPEPPELTSTPHPSPAAPSDTSASESASQDGAFQVITQEEVTKSIAAYDDGSSRPQSLIDVPNMSSSMLLSAEDLASGEINKQSEMWIKPGRSFAVPISISTPNTSVTWHFTVTPKDIEFSITYHQDSQQPVSQAEVLVAPTRCNSLNEPIRGELTAKQAGIYTLVFDNSYSRMTSKKVHYTLSYSS